MTTSRITLTIHIDIPTGAQFSVGVGPEHPVAQEAITVVAPQLEAKIKGKKAPAIEPVLQEAAEQTPVEVENHEARKVKQKDKALLKASIVAPGMTVAALAEDFDISTFGTWAELPEAMALIAFVKSNEGFADLPRSIAAAMKMASPLELKGDKEKLTEYVSALVINFLKGAKEAQLDEKGNLILV